MWIQKGATADALLSKKSDSGKMTSKELMEVIELLRHRKYKAIPKEENYILTHYYQWVHVENREIIEIDVEKHNINTGNLTDSSGIMISGDAAYGLITTAIDDGYLVDCADDDAYVWIATATDAGDLTDCADITISDNAADILIATAITPPLK